MHTGYAGNQLQQNSSGPSQKAIMGAMISRHQVGADNQVTGSMGGGEEVVVGGGGGGEEREREEGGREGGGKESWGGGGGGRWREIQYTHLVLAWLTLRSTLAPTRPLTL